MSNPTPSFTVNVDVTNPGQFFACCGLLELSHRLCPGAEGWFDRNMFHVVTHGRLNELISTTHESAIEAEPERGVKSIAPVKLVDYGLVLDYWLRQDWRRFRNKPKEKQPGLMSTRWKSWSGQQSSHQIISAITAQFDAKDGDEPTSLFHKLKRLKTRLGLDHRTAWNTLDAGFSPNAHPSVKEVTSPYVELFAAIGLQVFRPRAASGWRYLYSTWGAPLPARIAPAAGLGLLSPPGCHDWAFRIVKRGSYKGFDKAKPWERNDHD